jgi:ATP-dependent DNA helicase RecG
VLFGVTPSGKPAGQVVTDRTLEELAQEFRGFEPPLFPTLDRVAVGPSTEVIVLTVARSPRAPVAFRGV